MKKIYVILFVLLFSYGHSQVTNNCNNISFENGTTSGWSFQSGNITGVNLPCNNCATALGSINTVVTNSSTVSAQCTNGMDIYGGFPVLSPSSFGNHALLLNNNSGGGKLQQAKYSATLVSLNSRCTFESIATL